MGLLRKDFFRSLLVGFAIGAVGMGFTVFNAAHVFAPVAAASAAPTVGSEQ
ncbi:hypothetical protein J2792_001598 [Novosphingobium capsulatum]|uniref:Uncharacterized protein n=1 Tax=Novosphingobium capsulatum TaxID=13688 RepID=A0ABU1MKB5_9SPHN|nr:MULTISPECIES: hypothetical protein [Novosphingobium]MBB3359136.1 hypothetical protein [Novosphingobium sp. BK256]MBB3375383.1 hypothetical protein [Novosphingobium sp. BK280]MBB3379908.1 hypothetical protein [Novosphingobium sp. BK258]MBB3421603.1 hypothetical protein [Novosphingobium sp. BK267]MBB3449918.1 hypothetical protein [Novosphingobium sp. BK352]